MNESVIQKRQEETVELLEELEDALNTKGEINKQLKLNTWNQKISKRKNIWDLLAEK